MHLIKKVYKSIESRYYYSCIALFDFLLGIYGLLHINYLDSPKITPFHVRDTFSIVAGMTDDLWFNLLIIILGIVLLLAIVANKHKSSSVFFMISIFFLILICFAFSIRTIEQHYNITWLISLILVLIAIHTPREDGGKK